MEQVDAEAGAPAGQYMDAAPYRGHRVVVSGYVRTQDVRDGYAALWLRIDGTGSKPSCEPSGLGVPPRLAHAVKTGYGE